MTANARMSRATPASTTSSKNVFASQTPTNMARKCFASAALSSGFREKWAAVHEGCDIHVLPGAFTKIFRLAVDDVRGLLHHALSLGQGSHLDLFQKALRLELVLRQGAPPAHVQQRNEFMIRLLCRSGCNVIKKQVLLTLLPNWSREGFEILICVIDTRVMNAKELLMCSGNGFFYSTGRI